MGHWEGDSMAELNIEGRKLVRISTALFSRVENVIYIALGALLSAAALLALGGACLKLWEGLSDWTGTAAIFSIVDRLLFVLLLIEILHTVTASIRTGELTPEPFLIVGLIASIRRVLVITLQTAEATKIESFTEVGRAVTMQAMIELALIGGLILILVISLYLLRRRPHLVPN